MAQKNDAQSRFFSSLISAAIAESITLPSDVAKVRLQVQVRGVGTEPAYRGMLHCLQSIAATEGPQALWKGIQPALIRQCCYTSLSLVLYEPVRNAFASVPVIAASDGTPTFLQRLLAGGTAGGFSIAVFNWTEVLKTQMQTSKSGHSMAQVFRQVYQTDGAVGFLAGIKPNIARTFLVNAAELGTYDQAKSMLVPVLGENAFAHLGASTIAGVASACTSTPADVIKTRMMNSAGTSGVRYSGILQALSSIVKQEGFSALYKGFVPICVRKMLWCSIFFVSYEQIRTSMQ